MYGEDPAQTKPEQLLQDVAYFLNSFNAVRKELMMTSGGGGAGGDEGALKRKQAAGGAGVDAVATTGKEDIDELKSALSSGQAFEQRREQRRNARHEGTTLRGTNKMI